MSGAMPAPVAGRNLFSPAPQRIAVLRALHLGDLLCVVPALRALRAAAPHAHIALLGLPWARAFVAAFSHYLDELIEVPEDAFTPGAAASLAAQRCLRETRARRFDLVLQLHGSGVHSNAWVAAMGAAHSAGFFPSGAATPGQTWLPWRNEEHEVRRYLRLLRELGAPACGEHLEWPASALDLAGWRRLAALLGLRRGEYVVVHPGARLASRRWPAERFAQAAAALARAGRQIVLTGSAAETPLLRSVRERLPAALRVRVIDLGGRTPLPLLAAVIARARLLLCNDTGVSHLAAALRVPSVVVSSGGDAARWAPLARERHRVLARDMPCRPCAHERCPYPGHPCAQSITVDAVMQVTQAQLQGAARHA